MGGPLNNKSKKKKEVALAIAKVLCSCVLLSLLITKITRNVPAGFTCRPDFASVELACGAFLFSQLVLAGRQYLILRSMNRKVPISLVARGHFVGHSLTQVLPTSLGGDLARFTILRRTGDNGRIIRAILLSRFLGMVTLLTFVAISLPYGALSSNFRDDSRIVIGAISVMSLLALFTLSFAVHISRKRAFRGAPSIVRYCILILRDFSRNLAPRYFLKHSILSLLNVVCMCVCFGGIADCLNYSLPIISSLIAVPLTILVMFAPISFAGWGLRELGASSIFPLVGVPAETAILLSIGYGLAAQIIALASVCFFAISYLSRGFALKVLMQTDVVSPAERISAQDSAHNDCSVKLKTDLAFFN